MDGRVWSSKELADFTDGRITQDQMLRISRIKAEMLHVSKTGDRPSPELQEFIDLFREFDIKERASGK